MWRSKWVVVVLSIVLILLGIVVYGWMARPDWGRALVERWYEMRMPRRVAGSLPARVVAGAPAGTDLQQYGLKMAFVDGVRWEGVWRWGAGQYYAIFAYDLNGKSRWLIVPVRGAVSVRAQGGDAERTQPAKLSKALSPGEQVQLSFLHRFSDVSPEEAARTELIERRARATATTRQEAEREIGSFPARAWSDREVEALFNGLGVVMLDESQFLLSGIKKLWHEEHDTKTRSGGDAHLSGDGGG